MYNFTKRGEYLIIIDSNTNKELEGKFSNVLITRDQNISTDFYFQGVNGLVNGTKISFSDIQVNGATVSINDFIYFYSNYESITIEGQITPIMSSGGNISAQTASTGTNWTAFGSQTCKQLNLSNQSGTTIEVRQAGAGVGLQIPTGTFYTFFGISNTNQLSIRRVDNSNTQVTVTARWEA